MSERHLLRLLYFGLFQPSVVYTQYKTQCKWSFSQHRFFQLELLAPKSLLHIDGSLVEENDHDNDKNCDDSVEYCDEQSPTVFALFDTDLKHKCSSFALFPEKDQDEDHF